MIFQKIYIRDRFFVLLAVCIVLFALSFAFNILFYCSVVLLISLILACIADIYLCREAAKQTTIRRDVEQKLSLGDYQNIDYTITYTGDRLIHYTLYDDLPEQLQFRSAIGEGMLDNQSAHTVTQEIRPVRRGKYTFQTIHLLFHSILGLVQWSKKIDATESVRVYPSIIQMRRYALEIFNRTAQLSGIRRVRTLGENDEFEHIRFYNPGDHIKAINWKATARRNEIMVNQFQDTRSQNVYMVIDKGRAMKMPFYDMTLLDYAVNASLILSNIVLRKYDKAGILAFADEIDTVLPASSRDYQLEHIMHALYNIKTAFKESNYALLYNQLRRVIKRRSILIFYTNFEHDIDMERALPFLKQMNRQHILVLILFRNTALDALLHKKARTKHTIYTKSMGQRLVMEKERIADTLRAHGISTILTRPEDLNTEVINAYLAVKAKHMQ